jgi:hypothetical protein
VFLHETISYELYVKLIRSGLLGQLTGEECSYGQFVEENATPHITDNYMDAFHEVLGKDCDLRDHLTQFIMNVFVVQAVRKCFC